ncbi:uncharacterized protein areg [Leuresthes tenuis]|uniref:uncharacterized protein areg n=1 Tax=Leuresthes tenuis TaxID=355514 RepID=UPI003B50D9D0
MNTLILICLLCIVVCSARGAEGSEARYLRELAEVTRGPASGEGLQSLLTDDDELNVDEELSGGDNDNIIIHVTELRENKDEKKKGKRRNRHKSKITTPFNPEYTVFTNKHTSARSTTEDPCTSTHLGYCIHGYCKYMEGLQEPVCVCMKGYDGERCGIQTLEAIKPTESYKSELVQTVLVVIAVILSSISCCAILLMTCAHYRSHKNFMASYLGTGSEQEKLQKSIGDIVV